MVFSAQRAPGKAPNLEVLSLSAMSWPGMTAGFMSGLWRPRSLQFKVQMRFSAAERRNGFFRAAQRCRVRPGHRIFSSGTVTSSASPANIEWRLSHPPSLSPRRRLLMTLSNVFRLHNVRTVAVLTAILLIPGFAQTSRADDLSDTLLAIQKLLNNPTLNSQRHGNPSHHLLLVQRKTRSLHPN